MAIQPIRRRLFLTFPLIAAGLRGDGAAEHIGILLLAHGGRIETWNEEVNRVAAEVSRTYPTEVAFGMATRASIAGAAEKLTTRGVKRIIAVPLFISSHSSVIRSTEWLLGLREEMPEDYKIFATMSHGHGGSHGHSGHGAHHADGELMKPLSLKVPVAMTPALNSHAIVAGILHDRARAISRNAAEEVVVLVAHGPNPEDDNAKWLADLGTLAEFLRKRARFAGVEYLTVRDDAPSEIRDKAKAELRGIVEKAVNQGKTALVVPVLLSYGGIEAGIRKRLEGLTYTMAPQGLLPDKRIATWVLESARTAGVSAGNNKTPL